jgi:hypothetical protein
VETFKKYFQAGYQRLTPAILATQEAETRRIMDESQSREILHRPYLRKQGWWSSSSSKAPD